MNNDKKVTKVQKYTIEVIHYEDGSTEMSRTNDGFSVFGLIGILSHVLRHIHSIVDENYKPIVDTETINSTNSTMFPKPNEE